MHEFSIYYVSSKPMFHFHINIYTINENISSQYSIFKKIYFLPDAVSYKSVIVSYVLLMIYFGFYAIFQHCFYHDERHIIGILQCHNHHHHLQIVTKMVKSAVSILYTLFSNKKHRLAERHVQS